METVEPDYKTLSNTQVVEGVRSRDATAVNEMYHRYERGLRYAIARIGTAPQDIDDILSETIFTVVMRIQADKGPDNPECLPGFVRTIARRTAMERLNKERRLESLDQPVSSKTEITTRAAMLPSPGRNPEQQVLIAEQAALMRKALAKLQPSDVEILTRFYLQGQKKAQIRLEMGLTETQFRLHKSRAKSRLNNETKKLWVRKPLDRLLMPAA